MRPCPFPRLRPLLALAVGLAAAQAAFGTPGPGHLGAGFVTGQHVDPMLVHLEERLRWSRIHHNYPSPVDTPLDGRCLYLSCISLPSPRPGQGPPLVALAS